MKSLIYSLVMGGLLLFAACGGSKEHKTPELTSYQLNLHLKYTEIRLFDENGLAVVRMEDNGSDAFGLINFEGQEVAPCIYKYIHVYDGYYNMCQQDNTKKIFIPDEGTLQEFPLPSGLEVLFGSKEEGLWIVHDENYSYGIIDKDGKFVVPCRYGVIENFSEGMAAFEDRKTGRHGYLNNKGVEVIPATYFEVEDFSEGLGKVQTAVGEYKCGFIDKTGRVVISPIYDGASSFQGGLASVRNGDRYALIDQEGHLKTDFDYEYIGPLKAGVILYKEGEKFGLMGSGLNKLTPCQYDVINDWSDGMMVAKQNGKYGFVDEEGHEAVLCMYSFVSPFREGYARVARDRRVGYIDQSGKEIIMLPSNNYNSIYRSGFNVIVFRDGLGHTFLFDLEGNRLDNNGHPTPGETTSPAGNDTPGIPAAYPAMPAPAASGGSTSDPVRRAEWENRRNRAIQELTRLQAELIADPTSTSLKQRIQSQQNIINTCNEMIATYQ